MRLGSPRIVIFTRVARELAHNNPVNLCQKKKKFGRPYSEPWLFFFYVPSRFEFTCPTFCKQSALRRFVVIPE